MSAENHRNITDNFKTFQITCINELLLYLKTIFKDVDITILSIFTFNKS